MRVYHTCEKLGRIGSPLYDTPLKGLAPLNPAEAQWEMVSKASEMSNLQTQSGCFLSFDSLMLDCQGPVQDLPT